MYDEMIAGHFEANILSYSAQITKEQDHFTAFRQTLKFKENSGEGGHGSVPLHKEDRSTQAKGERMQHSGNARQKLQ